MNRFTALALLFLAVFGSSSCTSPRQYVSFPDQDVRVSSPEAARVYVMRKGQSRGAFRVLRIYDNMTEIGTFDQGQYLCWERKPGRGLIRIVYEGASLDGGDRESEFDLIAEAGQVYFIGVAIDQNGNKPKVGAIEEERARTFLEKLKRP
jgi:hypothetical protein